MPIDNEKYITRKNISGIVLKIFRVKKNKNKNGD